VVSFTWGQPDPQDMEACDEQKICTCRARGVLRRAAGNRLGSIGGRLRGAVKERRRQHGKTIKVAIDFKGDIVSQ